MWELVTKKLAMPGVYFGSCVFNLSQNSSDWLILPAHSGCHNCSVQCIMGDIFLAMLWSAITSQLLPPFDYLQIYDCTGNLLLAPWHICVTFPYTAYHCSSFFHLSARHLICLQFPVLIQSSVNPFWSGIVPCIRHSRVKSVNQWAKFWSPANLNLP
jgi:hypothetical protein